jgi:hypothetical protein
MIDIFVSAPADVQKEHAIAEQLIRSTGAEFNLPTDVWYSNPIRELSAQSSRVESEELSDKSTPVLCPCFWEYPESKENKFPGQIPSMGVYDLVICILWSQLGTSLPPECLMPDGSRPRSATDYEVAWALYQSKRTPGYPHLLVYRNRATAVAPLEPKEQRENSCRQWDAVQDFCAAWGNNAGTGFRECCHDFQDLEEFENLFRGHFREFLARRLEPGIAPGRASRKVPYSGSNPFRALDFFDFEHSALFQGRTRAVGEVLDLLKKQAAAKKPFVLVQGPSGSGKSSLVRAGVLPLITRGATPAGAGPWRHALTRPGGAGDPFDTLADALLAKSALPELQDATSSQEARDLASQLRKDPDGVAVRITKVTDQLADQKLDPLSGNQKEEGLPAKENENVEIAKPTDSTQVKPMTQLALVVDQLEELFTRFSPVLQQKYIAALCALANCQRVFIIATLRSDFYPQYQRFSGLTGLGGRYELQPPTPHGIGNIIRFRTEAAGLTFERDPDTNRSLDETIVKAAVANPEPLPLLEHLLSRLYERQLARKDGLLLWSDYRALGGFQDALAQHAEFVFLNLKSDEQQALKFVVRNLLVRSRGEESFLNRRRVPYRDLVSLPELSQRQRAGAKGLVDRLIEERLLSAEADPHQGRLISIPQEVMLRRWPRLWESLSDDRQFLRIRERLDAHLNRWITRGCQREDLLDRGIDLAEARTLLTDFRTQLNESQIDYIQKSLARHKPRRKVPQKIGLAAVVSLAIFAAFVGGERFNAERRRTVKEQGGGLRQTNAGLAASQRDELQAQLGTLEIRLKELEQKLEIAQKHSDLANSQRSELETELKKVQDEKAQLVQKNTDLANSQQALLETQRSLEAQLKKTEEKLQIAQQNADPANSQRSQLEAELKKAQDEKVQLAQQNISLANTQRAQLDKQHDLETQLNETQEKLRAAQKDADVANSQRDTLETQLKTAEEKLRVAQQNAEIDHRQRGELETQLKNEQAKLQKAQGSATPLPDQFQEARIAPVTLFGNETDSEEKQEGPQIEKYALVNLPQDPSPTPSPSPTTESETPKPPESQSVQPDDSPEKEPSVRHSRYHSRYWRHPSVHSRRKRSSSSDQ